MLRDAFLAAAWAAFKLASLARDAWHWTGQWFYMLACQLLCEGLRWC